MPADRRLDAGSAAEGEMSRGPRQFLRPRALVEVTVRTIQARYLLRPGRRLNEIFLGVLGQAQNLYPVRLHSVTCVSNHLHLLLTPKDSHQLSLFMGYVCGNLSDEIGRLYDWPGTVFPRRYTAIEVSDEEECMVERLKYSLSHGCKEGVVYSPAQWPGVNSAEALLTGKPLKGHWFSRTKEGNAELRGEKPSRLEFATPTEILPRICRRSELTKRSPN